MEVSISTTRTITRADLVEILQGKPIQAGGQHVVLEALPLPTRLRLIETLTRDGLYQAGWLRSTLKTAPEPGTPEWFAWIVANADRIETKGRWLIDLSDEQIEKTLTQWIEADFTPTVSR